jgi:N-acyl-phosphatidylethanolamine-hydrolysing phospholipase D
MSRNPEPMGPRFPEQITGQNLGLRRMNSLKMALCVHGKLWLALAISLCLLGPVSAAGDSAPAGTEPIACNSPAQAPERPSHHTENGFRNPDIPDLRHNRGAFFRWQWERFTEGLPRQVEGGWHPPVLTPDLGPFAARGPDPRLAWLGHDTFLLSIGGVLVLTDPQLSERASPVSWVGPRRHVPAPVTVKALPHIDAVVVSHNHYDHMDRATVLELNAQAGGPPQFFVPLGIKAWMEEQGVSRVIELDWWEHAELQGLSFHLVPAQHFSARTPFDTNRTLWGGWIVDHPSFRFYLAGDTGYGPLFKEIGRRFAPIDLAALPIGAYEPRWFMSPVHVDPEEAVRIHLDVGARRSVGMHWGTFQLTDEALDEPPRTLATALAALQVAPEHFYVLGFGESQVLLPRPGGAEAPPTRTVQMRSPAPNLR